MKSGWKLTEWCSMYNGIWLWRETPASSKLAFGKRWRFREVHRFLVELSYEQDRTGRFGSEGVKLGLGGGSRSRVSAAGAPRGQLQFGIGGHGSASAQEG